uniref:Uncharacterized protein n=1 Tax=Anguilla anguilla TaxID=7936 RepID=A0A0E9VQT2_ANGAN
MLHVRNCWGAENRFFTNGEIYSYEHILFPIDRSI